MILNHHDAPSYVMLLMCIEVNEDGPLLLAANGSVQIMHKFAGQ